VEAVYQALADRWPNSAWIKQVSEQAERCLRHHPHGDLPRWRAALAGLPPVSCGGVLDLPAPVLGSQVADPKALRENLMVLHPWRKGPLCLGGVTVDSEWRSDWKWARIAPHVDLRGRRVLDIGCGNGYFGLRMLGAGARLVVGVDPTILYVMQWLACRHFTGDLQNFVLPLGIEELPEGAAGFDAVFSMGVLYHRRDPSNHLARLKSLLRPGGIMVLETLVLPARQADDLLVPPGRYARMRNVWAIPGSVQLLSWVNAAGFQRVELVDLSTTTDAEQRSTAWMRFESLREAIDPEDQTRTVEGHPRPVRAMLTAFAN
jgi:tRNA (mo5U34)-methyltransferase